MNILCNYLIVILAFAFGFLVRQNHLCSGYQDVYNKSKIQKVQQVSDSVEIIDVKTIKGPHTHNLTAKVGMDGLRVLHSDVYSIMLLNVNSLICKQELVWNAVCKLNPDFFILNEVKTACYGDTPTWSSYNLSTDVRSASSGGVAVYTKKGIEVKSMGFDLHPEYECVWLSIGKLNSVVVVAPYIRPNLSDGVAINIFDDFQCKLLKCREMGLRVVVAGDLNGHIGDDALGVPGNPNPNPANRQNGNYIRDILDSFQCTLWNRLPGGIGKETRRGGSGQRSSILDFMFSFGEGIVPVSFWVDTKQEVFCKSDHNLIVGTFQLGEKVEVSYSSQKWCWKQDPDNEELNSYSEVSDARFEDFMKNSGDLSVQEFYDTIKSIIFETAEVTIGGKWVRSPPKKGTAKMITPGDLRVKVAARHRASVRKKWRDDRSTLATEELIQSTKDLLDIQRSVRDIAAEKLSDGMSGNQPHHRDALYRHADNIRRSDGTKATMKTASGELITSNEQLDREITQFYGKVFIPRPFPKLKAVWTDDSPKLELTKVDKILETPTIWELNKIIHNLQTSKKSAGVSNIPPLFLKRLGWWGRFAILEWIRKMWHEEETPTEVGLAQITLLHKKGPTSDVRNYRTLAVGCNICKLYLKLIEGKLKKTVEDGNLLGDLQNGFRKGRRGSDNLFILDTLITLAKKNNSELFVAFLDITKAYDRVNRTILWQKLRLMGIPEKIIRILIEAYRHPRGIIRFHGVETKEQEMPIGLKQGCVLSPLLFALFIADLAWSLQASGLGADLGEEKLPILLFADDMTVLGSKQELQKLLDLVGEYAEQNGLEFAGHKSFVVPFTEKVDPKRIWTLGVLNNVDGSTELNYLQEAESSKYLGILYKRKHPIYGTHIDEMLKKARRVLWMVRTGAKGTTHPGFIGGRMWEIYGKPAFLYGSEILEVPNTRWKELERVQRELLRYLLRLPRHVHSAVLYAETGVRPIRYTAIQSIMSYWSRLMCLDNSRTAKKALILQLELFRANNWDITAEYPMETDKEFSNCHLWLRRAWEASVACGLPLDRTYTKEMVKSAVNRLWFGAFWASVEGSSSLRFYSGRGPLPLPDPYLRLHTVQKWWFKARAGVAINYTLGKQICWCKATVVTLQHLIWECPLFVDNGQHMLLAPEGQRSWSWDAVTLMRYWTQLERIVEQREMFGLVVHRITKKVQFYLDNPPPPPRHIMGSDEMDGLDLFNGSTLSFRNEARFNSKKKNKENDWDIWTEENRAGHATVFRLGVRLDNAFNDFCSRLHIYSTTIFRLPTEKVTYGNLIGDDIDGLIRDYSKKPDHRIDNTIDTILSQYQPVEVVAFSMISSPSHLTSSVRKQRRRCGLFEGPLLENLNVDNDLRERRRGGRFHPGTYADMTFDADGGSE